MSRENRKYWISKLKNKGASFGTQFKITDRCNFKCAHCFPYYVNKNRDLSFSALKHNLDSLANSGCLFLNITGGEPLVRKDFFQIVQYAHDKSFAMILETNGSLITAGIADKLAGFNFWEVHVTILGANPDTHDKITGVKGSFKRGVSAIKLLKKCGLRVRMQSTLMQQNKKEAKAIKNLARKLAVESDIYYSHKP